MKGDQLFVYREFMNMEGVYQHHGIDCGDDTVIHYRKPSEIIEQTSFATFSRGNEVSIKKYSSGVSFPSDIVVARAKGRLGEDRYNFLFNNCEHFATWCKTGINDSKQIRNYIPGMKQFNKSKLYDLVMGSLKQKDRQLTKSALNDLKEVWEQVQPEYKKTLIDMEAWEKTAKEALKRDREDLARAALEKKRNCQLRAWKLEDELDELARMTENLLPDLW